MTIRKIISLPDPVLRQKAHRLTNFDPSTQALIADMIETMRAAPGVGLAATQIAESVRLIVVEFGDEEDEKAPKKLYVLANPEIIQTSAETELGIEACLSVPGLAGEVERFYQIVVKGQNRRGQPVRIKASGWLARIFQHEIDHLNGILFVDRATKVWKPTEDDAVVVAD
jgi:peptide deformylase